ncbi:MAG: ribosome maturation factor RimM [Peptococcaceae bacterium]|nr:ribosome maturation factor RimM [Peptococcaceae bacterium]
MMKRDITIGKVVSTYGTRGMLKVLPLTDFPDRFLDMDRVTLEQNGKQRDFAVTGVKRHRKHILIRLGQVNDVSAAETLRGALIKVGREELTPLPEDSYYIFDIVGLNVYSPEGEFLGVVEDVIQTGANDVYVVDTGDKKAPVLVPALKDVIREVDVKGGRMVVDYDCK